MKVAVWRPSADKDLEAALAFISEPLHSRFWQALEETVERIQDHPEIYPLIYEEKGVRRAFLKPFPYFLFYKVEEKRVLILALVGSRQDPERWSSERFD